MSGSDTSRAAGDENGSVLDCLLAEAEVVGEASWQTSDGTIVGGLYFHRRLGDQERAVLASHLRRLYGLPIQG